MRDVREGCDMRNNTARHTGDPYLDAYVNKYHHWMHHGMIRHSSKVIPIRVSLESVPWILPSEQTITYLREAEMIALTDCGCRVHYGRCDRPVRVCLMLDAAADEAIATGGACPISADEAESVIQVADQTGLVHLTLYAPIHRPFAVCNCCSCCCHDLQLLVRHGRGDLTVRSDYSAVTDAEACIHCGRCLERCMFGARRIERGKLECSPAACYGCGLCVSSCPTGAVSMALRPDARSMR